MKLPKTGVKSGKTNLKYYLVTFTKKNTTTKANVNNCFPFLIFGVSIHIVRVHELHFCDLSPNIVTKGP